MKGRTENEKSGRPTAEKERRNGEKVEERVERDEKGRTENERRVGRPTAEMETK